MSAYVESPEDKMLEEQHLPSNSSEPLSCDLFPQQLQSDDKMLDEIPFKVANYKGITLLWTHNRHGHN